MIVKSSETASLLTKVVVISISSFICLLFAVYIVENRSKQASVGRIKILDSFVQATHKYASTTEDLIQIESKKYILFVKEESKIEKRLGSPSNYSGNIYMDWISVSDNFDYINYKSLESLLYMYPNGSFIVNLIAADSAHYYKIGNLISKHYFQKYLKYGYNIQIKVIHRKFRVRFANDVLPLGSDYWNSQLESCCEIRKSVDINKKRDIPAHLYFYLRFFKLWAHGGMYSDFSWIHTRALDRTYGDSSVDFVNQMEGAVVKLACPGQGATPTPCVSSTLMAFQARSPVLECMLMQYNTSTSDMMQCIERDQVAEGAQCVADALTECFSSAGTVNRFFTSAESNVGNGIASRSLLVSCADLKLGKEEGSGYATVGVLSAVNYKAMCELSTAQYSKVLYSARLTEDSVVGNETFNSDLRMRREIFSASTAAVWLGPEGYSDQWTLPEAGSVLANIIAQRSLPVPGPFYRSQILSRTHSAATGPPPYVPYPFRVLGTVTPAEASYLQQLQTGRVTHLSHTDSCARYNYSFALPPMMQRQASLSCALHFVVPGFMKAGTTFLFGTMVTHPQLLNTLRGVTFKETGCYGPQFTSSQSEAKLLTHNRMQCFPFLEVHESMNMHFGDGTVWYNARAYMPATLLRDNPNLKVLFAIRNPVHRAQSHHRFNYKTFHKGNNGDLNEIVAYLLDPASNAGNPQGGSLLDLRAQAVTILSERDPAEKTRLTEKLVFNFQKKARSSIAKQRELSPVIKFSIYFPPVYYWFSKIPAGNVAVVPMERLQTHKLSTEAKLVCMKNLSSPTQFAQVLESYELAKRTADVALEESRSLVAQQLEKLNYIEDEAKRAGKLSKWEKERVQRDANIAKQRDGVLDRAYNVAQYNRIFRFLGLAEVTEIGGADAHPTGEEALAEEHKMNASTHHRLREYFHPFNVLLEELLEEKLGYNEEE